MLIILLHHFCGKWSQCCPFWLASLSFISGLLYITHIKEDWNWHTTTVFGTWTLIEQNITQGRWALKNNISIQACPGTHNVSHNIQAPLTLTQCAKLVRSGVVGAQPLLCWEGLLALWWHINSLPKSALPRGRFSACWALWSPGAPAQKWLE